MQRASYTKNDMLKIYDNPNAIGKNNAKPDIRENQNSMSWKQWAFRGDVEDIGVYDEQGRLIGIKEDADYPGMTEEEFLAWKATW